MRTRDLNTLTALQAPSEQTRSLIVAMSRFLQKMLTYSAFTLLKEVATFYGLICLGHLPNSSYFAVGKE